MKTNTLKAIDGLAEAVNQIASLLLPNCISELDRQAVCNLRDSALEVQAALTGEANWGNAPLINIQHEETGRLQEWPTEKPVPHGWAKVSEPFSPVP